MFAIGALLDGRYCIDHEIGRGGMGIVYEVVDSTDNKRYAVKLCTGNDEATRRRFAREIRFIETIRHENIISIVASNLEYEPPYMVMPLAKGSLADELKGGMDEDTAIESVRAICNGVRAIHAANGTHRDIKPGNVLRLEDGRLVVSDFGLVKVDPRETTVLTKTTAIIGTRIYCAPEQLMLGGSRNADARTDVYQVGKTLYHLLTGELPALISSDRLPRSLTLIIQRATRENPDDRYQSIDQFMDALTAYVQSKRPGASASRIFDDVTRQAHELAKVGQYNQENLNELIDTLQLFASQESIYIDQFNRIPIPVLQVLTVCCTSRFLDVLNQYIQALKDEVANRPFEFAETVAARMKAVFEAASDSQTKAASLEAILISAVTLNRYAAMNIFDRLLLAIKESDDAVAISDMLRRNIDQYRFVAGRISQNQLCPILHNVYKTAVTS